MLGDRSTFFSIIDRTITSIERSAVTSVGSYVFNGCTSLSSVSFPNCTSVGSYAFQDCTSLTAVNLPTCTTLNQNAFNSCTSLSSISLPACTLIGLLAFNNCTSFSTIYVGTSNCTLASSAFRSTGITPTSGSIYVPSSYVADYKTANHWSTYSTQIIGY